MSESSTENTSHALPAPSDVPDKGDETTTIRMTDKVKLDELGPLVVNTDGVSAIGSLNVLFILVVYRLCRG